MPTQCGSSRVRENYVILRERGAARQTTHGAAAAYAGAACLSKGDSDLAFRGRSTRTPPGLRCQQRQAQAAPACLAAARARMRAPAPRPVTRCAQAFTFFAGIAVMPSVFHMRA
jgi:hypothetical protein